MLEDGRNSAVAGERRGRYRRVEHVVAWSLVAVQLVLLAGLVWFPGERAWSVPGWLVAVAVVMIAIVAEFAVAAATGLGRGLTGRPRQKICVGRPGQADGPGCPSRSG